MVEHTNINKSVGFSAQTAAISPGVSHDQLPDKPPKEMQDHVLDVSGPLSTAYEKLLGMLELSNSDGVVELDKDSILNFLT